MPFGQVTVGASERGIARVALGAIRLSGVERPSALTNGCATQLLEYFSGKRSEFDLPLDVHGTPFQESVWRASCRIPYGQTLAPADVAAAIGRPEAARHVSHAAHENPAIALIPAHRIVPASGREKPGRAADLRAAFRELERRYS